jgi:hypothetical protein
MGEFGQTAGGGFGSFFTRTFSIVTFFVGLYWALVPEDFYAIGGDMPYDILIPGLLILGAHGMLTKSSGVGIIRQGLCYMSGVPGAVVVFNLIGQVFDFT